MRALGVAILALSACRASQTPSVEHAPAPIILGDNVGIPLAQRVAQRERSWCSLFLNDDLDGTNPHWPLTAGWRVVGLSCSIPTDSRIDVVVRDLLHDDEPIGEVTLPGVDGMASVILAARVGRTHDDRDPAHRPTMTIFAYSLIGRRAVEVGRWPIRRWIARDESGERYQYDWYAAKVGEPGSRPEYPRMHYFDAPSAIRLGAEFTPVLLFEPAAAWSEGTHDIDPGAPVPMVMVRVSTPDP